MSTPKSIMIFTIFAVSALLSWKVVSHGKAERILPAQQKPTEPIRSKVITVENKPPAIKIEETVQPAPPVINQPTEEPEEPQFRFIQPQYVDDITRRASESNDLMLLTVTSDKRQLFLNFLGFAQHRVGLKNWILFCAEPNITWVEELGLKCHLSVDTSSGGGVWQEYKGQSCPRGSEVVPLATEKSCRREVCNPLFSSVCLGFALNDKGDCWKCAGDAQRDLIKLNPKNDSSVFYYRPRRSIWYTRWQGLMELFGLGYNVLSIDLDAIIKQNPFPLLNKFRGSDLIVQRGILPATAMLSWGSAICMGFSYWRATNPKRRFIQERILELMKRDGDDQNAANTALFIEDLSVPARRLQDLDSHVTGSTPAGYKVTFLSREQFPRKCNISAEREEKEIVSHCYTSFKSQNQMRGLGNWCLKKNWKNITQPADLESYLDLIVEEE